MVEKKSEKELRINRAIATCTKAIKELDEKKQWYADKQFFENLIEKTTAERLILYQEQQAFLDKREDDKRQKSKRWGT